MRKKTNSLRGKRRDENFLFIIYRWKKERKKKGGEDSRSSPISGAKKIGRRWGGSFMNRGSRGPYLQIFEGGRKGGKEKPFHFSVPRKAGEEAKSKKKGRRESQLL